MPQKFITSNNTIRTRASITRPANTLAYAADEAVSGAGNEHFTFKGPGVDSQYKGELLGFVVNSTNAVVTNATFTLLLFSEEIGDTVDQVALSLTAAESLTFTGAHAFLNTGFFNLTANKVLYQPVSTPIQLRSSKSSDEGEGNIYGQLIAEAAYVPESGEVITIDLIIRVD